MIVTQAKMTMHNELASKFYDSSLQRMPHSQVILIMVMMAMIRNQQIYRNDIGHDDDE